MFGEDFAQDGAVIRGDGQIAAFVKLACAEARPFCVDLAAFHRPAYHEHAVRVAVIGAAVAIFARSAAELRHADEDDILHAIAHILMKCRDSLPQIAQQIAELTLHAAFVDVMVPAAAIEERDFEADLSFEKFGDFLQAFAEATFRILRAIFRLVGFRDGFF